jgi:hypothetical protein
MESSSKTTNPSGIKDIKSKILPIINKAGITIPILCILISVMYNFQIAYKIDYASKYGLRQKSECGNEYMEIESQNYQIYNTVIKNTVETKDISNDEKVAFIIIFAAWLFMIITLIIHLLMTIYSLHSNIILSPTAHGNAKFNIEKLINIIVGVVVFIGAILYIALSVTYTNSTLMPQIKTANIGDIKVVKSKTSKMLYQIYLPSLALLIPPIIYVIYKNQYDSIFLIYAILYTILFLVSYYECINFVSINSTIESNYSELITKIQQQINTIIGSDGLNVTAMPSIPPHSDSDKLKFLLIQNIKSFETTDGDNFILTDYKDSYWKYLIHQNGRELNDIYESSTNAANKAAIDIIRNNMRALRNDTSIINELNTFTHSILGFAIVILSIVIFAIFHLLYKHNNRPVTATMIVALLSLLLIITGPIYGIIMRVVSKSN